MKLWRFFKYGDPVWIAHGQFFVCPVWSWPRKQWRIATTTYALGPFRYVTWGGLRHR